MVPCRFAPVDLKPVVDQEQFVNAVAFTAQAGEVLNPPCPPCGHKTRPLGHSLGVPPKHFMLALRSINRPRICGNNRKENNHE